MSQTSLNYVDVDTVLSFAGDFGIYQYQLIVLFSFINVLSAYHYFGQTFIALIPEYECKVLNSSEKCFFSYEVGNVTIKEQCHEFEYHYEYQYSSIVDEVI